MVKISKSEFRVVYSVVGRNGKYVRNVIFAKGKVAAQKIGKAIYSGTERKYIRKVEVLKFG